LGTKFLEIAKSNSNGRLFLYTFEINRKAQLFYEMNEFKILSRDNAKEENLNDIKYEWAENGEN